MQLTCSMVFSTWTARSLVVIRIGVSDFVPSGDIQRMFSAVPESEETVLSAVPRYGDKVFPSRQS